MRELDEFSELFMKIQEASFRLWEKYQGKPYMKIRLSRYPGDKNPPLREWDWLAR